MKIDVEKILQVLGEEVVKNRILEEQQQELLKALEELNADKPDTASGQHQS